MTLDRALPLVVGDRLVLRHPGTRRILGGAQVLDADPPALRRRGASARRRAVLADLDPAGDPLAEVARRGAVPERQLRLLGLVGPTADVPDGVEVVDGWWVHAPVHQAWQDRLRAAVEDLQERDPLAGGLSRGAAGDLLALPDLALLDSVVRAAGLERESGRIRLPGRQVALGPAEAAIGTWSTAGRGPVRRAGGRRAGGLGLGSRELAAAERAGRLLRLRDGVVLLPSAPALAMRELARLPQPFTTSEARAGAGHDPAGGDPAAGAPGRAWLDPQSGSDASRGRTPSSVRLDRARDWTQILGRPTIYGVCRAGIRTRDSEQPNGRPPLHWRRTSLRLATPTQVGPR